MRLDVIRNVKSLLEHLPSETQPDAEEGVAFCREVLEKLSVYEQKIQADNQSMRNSDVLITATLEILIIALSLTTLASTRNIESALVVFNGATGVNMLHYCAARYTTLRKDRTFAEIKGEVERKMALLEKRLSSTQTVPEPGI